ncbi:MAG: recombination mediator RecR [Candidatus Sumerlaeia bacterium]
MAASIPPSLERLITHLTKLPTIGRRSAERLAFFMMQSPREDVEALAAGILEMREKLMRCTRCGNVTEEDPCPICENPDRETGLICVVESPMDAIAVESAGSFSGRYHILGGCLSPLKGVTASDLNLGSLDRRMESENVSELILAMNPSVEGEATCLFLMQRYRPQGIKVSRIALGLPMGGSLEHADGQTLLRAFEGRRSMD